MRTDTMRIRRVLFVPLCLAFFLGYMTIGATMAVAQNDDEISIADAREAADGTTVAIVGIVTRAAGSLTYLQDETAGIGLSQNEGSDFRADVEAGNIREGDEVYVRGTIETSFQAKRISGTLEAYEVRSRGNPIPPAREMTLQEIVDEGQENEGELVLVRGLTVTTEHTEFQNSNLYEISDATLEGSPEAAIMLRIPSAGDTEVAGRTIPEEEFGFVGVLGQRHETDPGAGFELRAIFSVDIFETAAFEAVLAGVNSPEPIATGGGGNVLAALNGDELVVRGSFAQLTSPLQEVADMGPAHAHFGAVGESGGIAFPLGVTQDDDQQGGRFLDDAENVITLNEEQRNALMDEGLYVNVHTTEFGGGEIRGQIFEAPNSPPSQATITSPADGEEVTVDDDPEGTLEISWSAADDPDEQPVQYTWQLATEAAFDSLLHAVGAGTETQTELDFETIESLLDTLGIEQNESVTVYHRVVASDGSRYAAGESASLTIVRGTAVDTEEQTDLPRVFALHGNYPNPFNPSTSIRFDLPHQAEVSVEVFDLLGRSVMTLAAQQMAAGSGKTLQINANGLASGTYLYQVIAETGDQTFIETGRMTLIR